MTDMVVMCSCHSGSRLALEEFNHYALILDVDGNGWSDRYRLLAHMNTPVLKQASNLTGKEPLAQASVLVCAVQEGAQGLASFLYLGLSACVLESNSAAWLLKHAPEAHVADAGKVLACCFKG
jgi:hypothetical protein